MAEPGGLSPFDMLVRAAAGIGKVDYLGGTGITLVSRDEIEAMALLLAALGLPAIPPDATRRAADLKAAALIDFFNTHFNGGSNER